MLYAELLFVFLLIVVNGTLAMSELAVVSSRRSRLQHLARGGDRGARAVLRLADDPGRFLSTVQIGITLVGVLAGAVGGATLADRLGDWLDGFSGIAPRGDAIAIAVVVTAITYLSLIIGELVPKRIALHNPEHVAMTVARPMELLARLSAPGVWLLKLSSDILLRLLRISEPAPSVVSEEEIKALIAEGTRYGIFAQQEREMIEGVMRLADRSVGAIMTPRADIVWLDIDEPLDTVIRKLQVSGHSRLLICKGSVDHAMGVVFTKDLLMQSLHNEPLALEKLMAPPLVVPETTPVLKLLDRFRRGGMHLAVVVDEYGVTQGIATTTDILEAIAGQLPDTAGDIEPMMVRREDGSWLVDGLTPIDEFEDLAGLAGLSGSGPFHTVAGFVLNALGHIPIVGESFEFRGSRFEVVDMDRRRIDKVLFRPSPREE